MPALGLYRLAAGAAATAISHAPAGDIWLLLGCGPVTAVPLMLYAFGAKLLRFSTIGIMQYIAPTMVFLDRGVRLPGAVRGSKRWPSR